MIPRIRSTRWITGNAFSIGGLIDDAFSASWLKSMMLAVLAFVSVGVAHAQDSYPSKPIRMIVPLAAGSAVDGAARLLTAKMSQNMGQPIVIENLAGSSGLIGADRIAKAAPDGSTIGGVNDIFIFLL